MNAVTPPLSGISGTSRVPVFLSDSVIRLKAGMVSTDLSWVRELAFDQSIGPFF